MTLDPRTSIAMVRPTLDDLPDHPLPAGYSLRPYQPGDEQTWIDIHEIADDYTDATLDLFDKQFGYDRPALPDRQLYLLDPTDHPIGTATAWYHDYNSQPHGQVHWVAIVPAAQGKGLAKPLLAAICHRLKQLSHTRVFLTTNPPRIPAIALYLTFGFRPDPRNESERTAWRHVRAALPAHLQPLAVL